MGRKGTKRKREIEEYSSSPVKRPKMTEPDYIKEQRNMEDLWQKAFPVGTEWHQLDAVHGFSWDFSNLENAFEEGGVLHGKDVYLFGSTEPNTVPYMGEKRVVIVPAVIAVASPFPPSDKIGIKSVQREMEEIVPMKQVKMDWIPYFSRENWRSNRADKLKSHIFVLTCTQRRAALKHLPFDRLKKFEYCLPYFYHPFKEDEIEQSTVVQIMFPAEQAPVVCEFDWELDELEVFTDNLIQSEELDGDEKGDFKEFVREKVREAKRANRQAREARRRAIQEMNEEKKTALENMRFYKFYPVQTLDSPDITEIKEPFINRYYGKAHQVL